MSKLGTGLEFVFQSKSGIYAGTTETTPVCLVFKLVRNTLVSVSA